MQVENLSKTGENNPINISPNPILQNSKLNIYWKDNISSNQFVEIFNANGTLIQKEMVVISSKTKTAFVFLMVGVPPTILG